MRRWGLGLAWVLVVALTTMMTWQIVSAADQRVGEPIGAPLNAGPPDTGSTATGASSAGSAGVTTAPDAPPSSGTAGASSSSSSSTPTGSSTPPPPAETVVIPSAGGTLTVQVVPGSVIYLSAVPGAGFALEIDDVGPPRVRVEFESEKARVEIRAEWRDGRLEVEIDVGE